MIIWLIIGALAACWLGIVFFGPPYVPTHRRALRELFQNLDLKATDRVVDLGAGDGRILVEAARAGSFASGVELNPFLVLYAKLRIMRYHKATITLGDIWHYRLPVDTTHVFVFFAGEFMPRLDRYLTTRQSRRPIKVISYGFRFVDRRPLEIIGGFNIYEF